MDMNALGVGYASHTADNDPIVYVLVHNDIPVYACPAVVPIPFHIPEL